MIICILVSLNVLKWQLIDWFRCPVLPRSWSLGLGLSLGGWCLVNIPGTELILNTFYATQSNSWSSSVNVPFGKKYFHTSKLPVPLQVLGMHDASTSTSTSTRENCTEMEMGQWVMGHGSLSVTHCQWPMTHDDEITARSSLTFFYSWR